MNVEILKRIVAFQKSFDGVVKNRENEFLKSKYANLEDVMESAGPSLESAGLHVCQPLAVVDGANILRTVLFDDGGNFEVSEMNLDTMCPKPDAQRVGSAVTYARRYSFCAMLNILTFDDDGHAAVTVPESKCTEDQTMEITGLIETTGTDKDKVIAHIKSNGWGDSITSISFKQAATIIGLLKGKK